MAVMVQNQQMESALRRIDQEILKFWNAIRRLKSERNEMQPISQLPPELLAIETFGEVVFQPCFPSLERRGFEYAWPLACHILQIS